MIKQESFIDKDDDEKESLVKGIMIQIMSAPFNSVSLINNGVNFVNSYF